MKTLYYSGTNPVAFDTGWFLQPLISRVSNEQQPPFKIHREQPETNQYYFLKKVLCISVVYKSYE